MAGNVVSNVKKYYGGQVPVPAQGDSDGKVKVLVEKTATIEIEGVQTEVELLYDADDMATPVTPQQLGQWTDENYLIAFKSRDAEGTVRGFILYALETDSTSTDTLVNRATFVNFKEDMNDPGASAYVFGMVEDSSTLTRYLRDSDGELIVKFNQSCVEDGAQSGTLDHLIATDSTYMEFEVVHEGSNAYLNLNTAALADELDDIHDDINYILDALAELPSDEHGYFNTSLYTTPGDGTTTNLVMDNFRITENRSVHGDSIEFVPTHQEGGIDFGEVYLNPGTYILNVHYTLQWVGNPRGTFQPLVANVGEQPFDFSYEHEDILRSTRIVTRTTRGKFSLGFPIDADTPPMGIWVKYLEIAQIASYNHPAVVHDITLTGKGQLGDPLGVTPAAFGKVKDIPTSISQFRTGDVIPVDGPNGPAKIGKDDLTSEVSKKYFAKIPVTYTDNKFVVYTTGAIASLASLSASDYIDIGDASVVNINKAITERPEGDARGAAFYDFNKTFISGYQYTYGNPNVNISVPPNARYIRFTAMTSESASTELCKVDVFGAITKTNHKVSSVIDSLASVMDSLASIELGSFVDDKYIAYSDGKELSLNGVSASDYIDISNASKVRLIATGYDLADARGAAFYDLNKTFISGYQYPGGGIDVELSIPSGAKYIRFTTGTADKSITRLYLNDLYGSFRKMNNAESAPNTNVLVAFSNIVCIGDSLTWSQVYTSDNSQRQAYRTYPQVLGKLCGTDSITTLARPGDTVVANWNRYKNDIGAQANALAIIYLGTNYGLTDTLSEDAPENTDPSTWADTNTGDYAKWVSKLQSLGYKMLLIKPFVTSNDTLNTTKAVIDQIGTRFGCAVLESFYSDDYKYHYYPDLSGLNGVHYNDLGYAWFASTLINRVSMLPADQMKLIIPA